MILTSVRRLALLATLALTAVACETDASPQRLPYQESAALVCLVQEVCTGGSYPPCFADCVAAHNQGNPNGQICRASCDRACVSLCNRVLSPP